MNESLQEISAVVLSGGGHKGYAHLGALSVLVSDRYISMDNLKVYAGTSVGSIITFLMCLDISPTDIARELLETPENILSPSKSIINFDMFGKFGLVNMDVLKEKIVFFLKSRNLDPSITFEDILHTKNKHFICVATNINKKKCVYFSPTKTPGFSCLDAVLASCCIPLVFQSQKIAGEFYVDGGVSDNFPIDYVKKYMIKKGIQGETFGILLREMDSSQTIEPSNLAFFIYNLVQVSLHNFSDAKKYKHTPGVLILPVEKGMGMNDVFNLGMRRCQEYFIL
jgi:predicted acylesterase/phospholipase RssA